MPDQCMSSWSGRTFFVCVRWRRPNNIFFSVEMSSMSFCFSLVFRNEVLSGDLIKVLINYFIVRLFYLFSAVLSSNRMERGDQIEVRYPDGDLTLFFTGAVKWYKTSL